MTVKNQFTNLDSYSNFTDNYGQNLQTKNKLSTCVLVLTGTEKNRFIVIIQYRMKRLLAWKPSAGLKAAAQAVAARFERPEWVSSWYYSRHVSCPQICRLQSLALPR